MVCPKCHYALSPFDADCPRCRNFATLGIVVPDLPQAVGEVEAAPTIPNTAVNGNQSTPTGTAEEPWYSNLDLENEKPSDEEASEAKPAQETVAKPDEIVSAVSPLTIEAFAHSALEPVLASMSKPSPAVLTSTVKRPAIRETPVHVPPTYPSPTYTPRIDNAQKNKKQKLNKKVVFLWGGFAVLAGLAFVIIRTQAAAHAQQTKASRVLTQAKGLIAQANANAIQFQQVELTPQQADVSLHTQTAQYQEALRLCRASEWLHGGETALGLKSAAVTGLQRTQADTTAQAARVLTAQVAESISLYKGRTLTDEQAASIRATLRAKCQLALADCTQTLQSDPDNSVALAQRVLALRYLGDTKSADAAFIQAITLCPNNPVLLAAKGDHG